jgi:hypothetical protein
VNKIPDSFLHKGVKTPRWLVLEQFSGSPSGRVYAMLSSQLLSKANAHKIGEDIATRIGRDVIVVMEHRGPRRNPTLVHHGKAKSARWHVVTAADNYAVADLYGMLEPNTASKIVHNLATALGAPLLLLSNFGQPKTLAEHSIAREVSGSLEHRPQRNPAARPRAGELWTTRTGGRCKVLAVSGDRVQVLHMETGNREWIEMPDFLASYKLRGPQANPRRLNFPKVPADSLKVGDMVMPPEREMRLWMIRDAAEKGMSPSDLGILLTDVHEGEPDKGGRWIFLTGYLRDQWYAGRRQYPMKFKARPNTPWPVAARPAQDNPARSPGARARRKAARSSRRSVGQGIGGRRVLRALSRGQRAKAQHIALQSKYRYHHRHAPVPSSNPATARADRPGNDRDFAAKVIRDNLKKRSGKPWSVTVGRGTAWGWLHLDAPNRRRTWHWRLKSPDMPDYPENYEEYDTGQPGGHMGPIERAELAGLLGLERLDSYQGISIPGASDYYDEYMDRAQGRTPEREGKPYWDNPSRSRRAQYGRASRRAAPRGVPGLGSRRAARAIRSGRAAKAHYHMMSTADRGRFRPQSNPAGRFVFGQPLPTGRGISASIRPGDRVTYVDRFGKQHTGRAVMPSSHGGWVLNMGGAHGTPAVVDDSNIVKVSPRKNPRVKGATVTMTAADIWNLIKRWPASGLTGAKSIAFTFDGKGDLVDIKAAKGVLERAEGTGALEALAQDAKDIFLAQVKGNPRGGRSQRYQFRYGKQTAQDFTPGDVIYEVVDMKTKATVFRSYNERDARVRASYLNKYGPEVSRRPADHPAVNPRSPLAVGESVSVPYTGKSKKRTSERGVIQAIGDDGIYVQVTHGKSGVVHVWQPDQVRRARRKPWDVLKEGNKALASRLELQLLRKRQHEAEAAEKKALADYECAEAKARQAQPVHHEDDPAPYRRFRAEMTRAKKRADAYAIVAYRLSQQDPDRPDPFAPAETQPASNPRHGSEMARARRTSEMWHEFPPSHVRRVKGPGRIIPKTLVALGEAVNVDYKSNKYTGRMATYTHSFKRPRPILATDPDAKHLHIVGGNVKITADGLVN